MQRKIVLSLGGIILFFGVVLLLIGCKKDNKIFIDNKSLGIIEKDIEANKSFVKYYSHKINSLKRINLKEQSIGSVDSRTKRFRNNVFVLCNDMKKKYVESKFLKIDLEKDRYVTYKSDECINEIDVEDNIYTISSVYRNENISYVSKISKDMKLQFKLRIRNIVLSDICVKDNNIYATGFDYNNEEIFSKMYIIDKNTMNIKKEIDISDYVVDVSDMLLVEDRLYIGGRTRRNNRKEEVDNINLTWMNLSDYSLENRYIGDKVGQFLYKDNILYFSNYDEVLDSGKFIYAMNMKTNKIARVKLNDHIRDMTTFNEKIYLMGKRHVYKCNSLKNITGKRITDKKHENIGFLRN